MVTEIWVNMGSGNGFLPDGNKPLPEPMLTDHQWSPVTFILGLFHWRCLNHQSWNPCENYISKISFKFSRGQWDKHCVCILDDIPDSKVHGANMGPIWGWQDPGGPHVGPMNFCRLGLVWCASAVIMLANIWAHFLSLARSMLRLWSVNHRAGYFSNLACDWLSIVWAYRFLALAWSKLRLCSVSHRAGYFINLARDRKWALIMLAVIFTC